jgi:PIN domain nuclease of toxin-antitoxin system
MRVLLDTHAFLWAITADARLSPEQHKAYLDESNDLLLSTASLWEMLIKVRIGKLFLPQPAAPYIFRQMDENRIATLPIRPQHLYELELLAPLHSDPFDRMLVAQARAEGIPVMTADPALGQYGVQII